MSAIVEAAGLHKTYGTGASAVHALRGVSFDVKAGEVLVLMGPSGSGKTTLLSLLSGILTPSAGSVRVMGTDISHLNRTQLCEFRRRHYGFVFQGFNLFGALSARENVEVALSLKGQSGAALHAQSLQLLDRAGVGQCGARKPADLSGGEKQRVSVARALAGNPSLVMADEPTASLDWEHGKAAVDLLCSLAKSSGATVLIVTHDQRVAEVADRVCRLADGVLA